MACIISCLYFSDGLIALTLFCNRQFSRNNVSLIGVRRHSFSAQLLINLPEPTFFLKFDVFTKNFHQILDCFQIVNKHWNVSLSAKVFLAISLGGSSGIRKFLPPPPFKNQLTGLLYIKLKSFCTGGKLPTKWKGNLTNGRKYLQIIYLIKS